MCVCVCDWKCELVLWVKNSCDTFDGVDGKQTGPVPEKPEPAEFGVCEPSSPPSTETRMRSGGAVRGRD